MTLDELMTLPQHQAFAGFGRAMYMLPTGTAVAGWSYSLSADIKDPPLYLASDGTTHRLSELYSSAKAATILEAKAAAIARFAELVARRGPEIEARVVDRKRVAANEAKTAALSVTLSLDDLELNV